MATLFDGSAVLSALERSWSEASARQWQADNPALGQCNVTALLIHDLYGGDILKTPLPAGDHFYNLIDGERVDCTASQFGRPIDYADLRSRRDEASGGVTDGEYAALKSAFLQAVDALD